jgi:hypothetical protein
VEAACTRSRPSPWIGAALNLFLSHRRKADSQSERLKRSITVLSLPGERDKFFQQQRQIDPAESY